jgi:hypothetical protein
LRVITDVPPIMDFVANAAPTQAHLAHGCAKISGVTLHIWLSAPLN